MKKNLIVMMVILSLMVGVPAAHAAGLKLGIVWMEKSSMTERIQAAFTEEIKNLVDDVDIEFQHVEELTDFESVTRIVRRYEKEKDGIILLRSNGAKWLSENKTSIPTFIGATNNPEVIGAVKNMSAPEGNVTGVTYYLPHEAQFQIFEKILPDMKSILLLLEKGHASSDVDRDGTREACKKRGIDYYDALCSTQKDSIEAVQRYKDKVSAIIIGTNALNIDNSENIIEAAGDTPVLSFTDKPVKNGALAGYVPDDQKRGRMLARSVYEVLVMGKPIREVPVKMDPDPVFLLNSATFERLKLNVPYSVLKHARFTE